MFLGRETKDQRKGCSESCWLLCRAKEGGRPDEMRDQCRLGPAWLQQGTGDVSDQGDD